MKELESVRSTRIYTERKARGWITENISATGNLNVGVVIQYDEHAAHALEGAAQDRGPSTSGTSDAARTPFALPVAEGPAAHSAPSGGDNANVLQTATQSTPSSSAIELPTGAERSNNFSPATAADAGPSSSGTSSHSSSSSSTSTYESSGMSSTQQSPNGNTTYNTTNNYESTTNNYNYTENNTYNNDNHNSSLITIGNITINDYLPGMAGGGGIINNFTSIITNEVNTINNVTNNTSNSVTDNTLSIVNTTLNTVTHQGGDILATLTNDTFNLFNTITNITNHGGDIINSLNNDISNLFNTVNNVTNHGGDIINSLTSATSNLLNNVTNATSHGGGILTGLNSDISNVLNTINNATGHGGDIVSGVNSAISNILNTGNGVIGHGAGSPNDTLSSLTQYIDHTIGHLSDTPNTVLSTVNSVTSGAGDTMNGLLGGLVHDVTQAGNTTLSQTSTVVNNAAGEGAGTLNPIIAAVNGTLNDPLASVGHGGLPAPLPDLSSIPQTVNHTLNTVTGGDPVATVAGLAHDAGGLPDISNTTGTLSHTLSNVSGTVAPVGMSPIVDASASALSPSAPHASDALINVNGNVASGPQSSHANGGLITVDTSVLSPHTNGFDSGNGASVALTPSNVSHDPVSSSLSPQISIALPPSPSSVPITSDASHAVSTVSSGLHDVGNAFDPAATLNALMQAHNVGTAVDAGVLFAGAGVSSGHDSSSIPHASDVLQGNHIQPSVLHGLHG